MSQRFCNACWATHLNKKHSCMSSFVHMCDKVRVIISTSVWLFISLFFLCLILFYSKLNSALTATVFAIDLLNGAAPLISPRKIKRGLKNLFSLSPRFSALSSLRCCPRQPCSNSKLLTHLLYAIAFLSVCLCVLAVNVWGVNLLQHVQYRTTGPHNPDNNSNDARPERRRDVMRDGTELSAQSKPICLLLPIFKTPPTAYKTYHTYTHAH